MRKQRITGSVAAVAMLAVGMAAGVMVGTAHAADEMR